MVKRKTKVCIDTSSPFQSSSRHISSFKNLSALLEIRGRNLLLIGSTLHVVTKHNQNTQNDRNSSAIKRFLEALLIAKKMSSSFTTDVVWMNTEVCSVTSKASQSSNRCLCFIYLYIYCPLYIYIYIYIIILESCCNSTKSAQS